VPRKYAFAVQLFCLVIVGCAPQYLADLDIAAPLTGQMTLIGTVGPVSSGGTQAGLMFLPVKPTAASTGSLSVQAGFLVTDSSGSQTLSFVFNSGGSAQTSGNQTFSLAGADPNYSLYEFDVTTTASNEASIIVFNYNPATIASSQYEQFVVPLSTNQMGFPSYQSGWAPLTNNIDNGYTPIGGCVEPSLPPAQDFYAVLLASGTNFAQGGAQVNDSTSIFPSTAGQALLAADSALPPFLGTTTRSLYYSDPTTGTSFADYFSGGQWTCLGLNGPTIMTGITHRIDAILTTGDLLSTQGGTLRLYDTGGTGTQLYAISLDGLQFCYEAYIGSAPYVFFSLPISLQNNEWVFNIYAVPTSSMRSLKG